MQAHEAAKKKNAHTHTYIYIYIYIENEKATYKRLSTEEETKLKHDAAHSLFPIDSWQTQRGTVAAVRH